MQVHPDISALRSNQASQRRLQDAVTAVSNDWHSLDQVARVRRELVAYASDGVFERGSALFTLLNDLGAAKSFLKAFLDHFLAALRIAPLAEVPFRHNRGEGFARMQLLQSAGAVLSLCVYEPARWEDAPATVQFTDCEIREIFIAGCARGRVYRRHPTTNAIQANNAQWRAGTRILRRPLEHARHVLQVEEALLSLQLTRIPPRPRPTLEFRLSDGKLVREASGDKRASEQVMALGVLGALGDKSVLAPIATFAREREHDCDARWEALRQLLALDSGRGFALLWDLAASGEDPLSNPACELQEMLAHAHPQLRAMQKERA